MCTCHPSITRVVSPLSVCACHPSITRVVSPLSVCACHPSITRVVSPLSVCACHPSITRVVSPLSVCACHPSITRVVSPHCVRMPPFNHMCCVTSLCQTVDLATANATEEDKLRAAMDQASQYYHPSQYVPCTHTQSSTEIHYQDRVNTTMCT